MKLSDKILMVASWLEDSENDLVVNADSDADCLETVASALVKAANELKTAADIVAKVEPEEGITEEKLDKLAAVAELLDDSDDELIKKQASVLDELLLTIAAPRGAMIQFRETQDDRIEELKKKYKGVKEKHDDMNKVSDSVKKIEEAPKYKKYRVLEAPLSTRYCPEHAGVLAVRIGEHTVQCVLDKKVYNYEAGYTLNGGEKVPGGDVSEQTKMPTQNQEQIFDTRNQRLGIGDQNGGGNTDRSQ